MKIDQYAVNALADPEQLLILDHQEKFNIEVYANTVLSLKRLESYHRPNHLGKIKATQRRLHVICADSNQDIQHKSQCIILMVI